VLITYQQQIIDTAAKCGVDLRSAFIKAGLPTSTFQRMQGGAELRASTAKAVLLSIADMATEAGK